MRHLPSRFARVLLLLLVVGAPVTVTLAFESAAAAGPQVRQGVSPAASRPGTAAATAERIKGIEAPK